MLLAYVGARLGEIDRVRQVQQALQALSPAYAIDYDWTREGSRRGDPEALAQIAPKMLRAASRADAAVYLLANGERSPQAGLHCELGASLAAGVPVFLWTPKDHGYLFDPTNKRCKSFYVHPQVSRLVEDDFDQALQVIKLWALAVAQEKSKG